MAKFESNNFVSNNLNLHYYRSGSGINPLVLIHGITDDGLCWTPVAEELFEEYDIVMPDMRGHGKSGDPDEGYDETTMAHDTARLIKELGLEKPVIIGHSMGALITLALAGLYPELPGVIIVEDPPPFWNSYTMISMPGEFSLRNWIKNLKRKTRAELIENFKKDSPQWSSIEINMCADAKHRFSPKIDNFFINQEKPQDDLKLLYQNIICPVLFIGSDQKLGGLAGSDDITVLNSLIPQLKTAIIEGAGHNIRRDQFVPYMNIVRNFLSDISFQYK
jgi:N-formylmaleamate deformylase